MVTQVTNNITNAMIDNSINDVHANVVPNQKTQEVTVSGWGYIQGDDTTGVEDVVSLPYVFNANP